MEKKYAASLEIKEVSALSLEELVSKMKAITAAGEKLANITAVVVTTKLL